MVTAVVRVEFQNVVGLLYLSAFPVRVVVVLVVVVGLKWFWWGFSLGGDGGDRVIGRILPAGRLFPRRV